MATVDVVLEGEIDVAVAPQLRQQLADAVGSNPGATIAVDLSKVEFLDSTGLGLLVGAMRRARELDGSVVLVGPKENVAKVFRITGLDKVFEIRP